MPSRFVIEPVITHLGEDAEGYIEVDDADCPRQQVNRIASAADNLPFSREGWLYASDAHPALLSDQRIAWAVDEETVDAPAFEAMWAQAAAQERVRARLPMLDVMITLAEAWARKGVSPVWDPELVTAAHTIGQTTSLR
ncbi:hypothetical protein [Deinococcus humi]|uniref:Uncharacterized protein n=1 Tax=Deinococcus humi TaxID=662880 RepID=A0A7W8NG43_9DEIO|nr:hypothetical protein [Deinococcus humi]MBB5366134.1 hypothetical protein [Deinococcus humi]GGO40244.1 hypothetical protein GCM10008949_49510 [Deinococcus humi]